MNDQTENPRLIVGIGASAGGIEACKTLFTAAPADAGIAWVVVLHLAPERTSHVAEILQHHTELSVRQVRGTEKLKPDYVYVIAPNSELQFRDGTLKVERLNDNRPRSELVDLLFASLADTEKERAVGVVLSGAGHDGCEGLRKIHAVGGLCVAQTPSSATLAAGMPRAAIDAGIVDAVLDADLIPGALVDFAHNGARPAPALNEEMNTINRELEDKNSDLRAANADLNNLFLNTGIPTIFLDSELGIRRFTPAAADVMRLGPSDVGRSIAHVKERYEDGRTVDEVRQVMDTLQPRSQEVWTENDRCYLRLVQPYRKDDQEVDGVCITFTDVTEQRQAAIESEAARRYAEAVIQHVRTPLLVIDEHLSVVTCNPAFAGAFDVKSPMSNRRLEDCTEHAWYVADLERAIQRELETGEDVTDLEIRIGEHIFLVNLSSIPRDQDDDLVLVSFEDVTKDRRARDAAAERQEELSRDARRKDQWIAMLGHELRNPIGAIANGIELSRHEGLDPERRAGVHRMLQRQLRQMNRLLDDLLDAGRVIAGKLQIAREPVDISQVVAWSLETVGSAVEKRRHELVVENLPPQTAWVEGDANRLSEVLANLLGNAAKYTDPGGRIRLSVAAGDDHVSIAVEDDGAGITADFMPHIFEVFSQGPRGLDRSAKGLGLGLPLVQNIVQMHGGTVRAESEGEGKGSRFEVRLPRIQHDPGRQPAAQRNSEVAPRRVLVVDDERDSADTLAQLLQASGHQALAVRSGKKALSVAASFDPEVVLLDLGMPGMDGYEVARRLRADGCKALLVALTGYLPDLERQRDSGIDHHLIKPVDHARLADLLASETGSA